MARQLTDVSFRHRFAALDDFLTSREAHWRPRPFLDAANAWARTQHDLRAWLQQLDDQHVAALENDEHRLCGALAPFVPDIEAAVELARVPSSTVATFEYPHGFARDVPGRKWAQITAFAELCTDAALPLLDWCAGKGHLSRVLRARHGHPVTALEIDARLTADGHRLAHARAVDVAWQQADARDVDCAQLLASPTHIVALHACGDLHLRAFDAGIAYRAPAMTVAPCCHHLSAATQCLRSTFAQRSQLRLRPTELQLATQETLFARADRRAMVTRQSAFRLGFDALQREQRGIDAFLPLPSAPRRLFRGDFASFCAWALEQPTARRCNLRLDNLVGTQLDAFEQRGRELHDHVRRLSLVRHAFRRPLEVWLLLDRGMYLEDNGYTTSLTSFVPRMTTPRNLVLRARRDDN